MKEFPIIAIYENPDVFGEWYQADPYVIYANFNYQGMKIRASIRVADSKLKIAMKVDRKRKKPRLISVSKFLHCIEGCFIEEDGKYYVTTSTIGCFLEGFARIYVIRTFNLPYQMELPLYQLPVKSDTEITHPTLKVLTGDTNSNAKANFKSQS